MNDDAHRRHEDAREDRRYHSDYTGALPSMPGTSDPRWRLSSASCGPKPKSSASTTETPLGRNCTAHNDTALNPPNGERALLLRRCADRKRRRRRKPRAGAGIGSETGHVPVTFVAGTVRVRAGGVRHAKPSDTATLPVRIRHTHLMSLRIGLVSATSHRVRRWRRYDHPGDQRRRRGRHCQSTSAGAVALLFHGMTSPPLTATLASMSLCSMRPNRFRLS